MRSLLRLLAVLMTAVLAAATSPLVLQPGDNIAIVGSGLAVITLRKTRVVYDRPLAIGTAAARIAARVSLACPR